MSCVLFAHADLGGLHHEHEVTKEYEHARHAHYYMLRWNRRVKELGGWSHVSIFYNTTLEEFHRLLSTPFPVYETTEYAGEGPHNQGDD